MIGFINYYRNLRDRNIKFCFLFNFFSFRKKENIGDYWLFFSGYNWCRKIFLGGVVGEWWGEGMYFLVVVFELLFIDIFCFGE